MKSALRISAAGFMTAVLLLAAALTPARASPAAAGAAITLAPWSAPVPVVSGLAQAARPVLAHTADGTTHALWESDGSVFYALRAPGQTWGQAQRMAYGIEPAMTVDSQGQLHAIFANQFLGNYEIYHVTHSAGKWSLPKNISRTTGVSMRPALAAGTSGQLHATWMDNSPGHWTIYAAAWSGGFWSNQPVPNARGQSPAIATTPSGAVFLTWQDRVPTLTNPTGVYSIFLSEWRESSWSLPINISDRENVDSIGASVTTTSDGLAHLVWIEGLTTVRYDYGKDLYWPPPQTVHQADALARGPRIAADKDSVLHIVWDEGEMLRVTSAPAPPPSWPPPETVTVLQGTLKDVSLSLERGRAVWLTWVQAAQPGGAGVYESHYRGQLPYRIWLPITLSD